MLEGPQSAEGPQAAEDVVEGPHPAEEAAVEAAVEDPHPKMKPQGPHPAAPA